MGKLKINNGKDAKVAKLLSFGFVWSYPSLATTFKECVDTSFNEALLMQKLIVLLKTEHFNKAGNLEEHS